KKGRSAYQTSNASSYDKGVNPAHIPARRPRYDFFSGARRTKRSSLGAHASSVLSASKIPACRMRALPAGRAEILSKKQRILGLVVRSSPAAALRLREIPP